MFFKKIMAGVTAFTLLLGCMAVPAFAEENEAMTKIFIVGDSTACNYGNDDNYALPRAGWGMYLGDFVNNAEVVDLAKSGRSSKSLTVEKEYQTLLDEMGKDDYLLIQFGHNDAKKSSDEDIATRYTDPDGDKDTEGSFKNSLYKNYIKPAQEAGAKPILITPISRRSFNEDGSVKDTHGRYDDAVRELGEELGITVIDATKLTADAYSELGEKGTATLHAIYASVEKGDKGHDNTHLNHFGAKTVASLIANALRESGNDISEYIAFSGGEMKGMTRFDYTSSLVRLIGEEYKDNSQVSFPDVAALQKDTTAIYTAKNMGIVTGDDKGEFHPDDAITFEDMAVVTARALEAKGISVNKDKAVLDDYKGKDSLSAYAEGGAAVMFNSINSDFTALTDPKAPLGQSIAFAVLSNVYDILNSDAATGEAQSIDEIEKVE